MGRLFWKFFFAFWCALLAAALGAWLVLSLYNQRSGPTQVATGPRASFMVETAADLLVQGDAPALGRLLDTWEGLTPELEPVFVVNIRGDELFGRPFPDSLLTQARDLALQFRPGGNAEPWLAAARQVATPNGSIHLVFAAAGSTSLSQSTPSAERRPPPPPRGLPLIVGLLASLVFSALLAWHFAKPVRLLRWALGSVAAGNLDTRVRPLMGNRRDEIADLSRDFDRMTEELQHHIAAQRRLLHDVSHELRSPLARLQAAIGLARQDPAKMAATLDRIERESLRLDRLVGEILTLARLEARPDRGEGEPVDLADLLGFVVEDVRFEADQAGKKVLYRKGEPCHMTGHIELLHRAFENILRNAVHQTAPGTAVEVSLTRQAGASGELVRITVCDHGPGVPDSELEEIFAPFYRASIPPGSTAVRSSGFGLGLAIARRAVEAHKGMVRAMNREKQGLCVDVLLPLDSPTP